MSSQYKRTSEKEIQLVIFDWAGTTVDFGCQAPVTAFVKSFKRQTIEVSMETARIPMGMEKEDHIRAIATMEEVSNKWLEIPGRMIDESDIDRMFVEFTSLLLESIEAKSGLIPGVTETVGLLRENGIKIGASTGYFTETAEIVKDNEKNKGYTPNFTICASDVLNGRPEP